MHHTAFLHLKEVIIQAPILCYPDPDKKYIVYTDASDNACRAQLSQEHNGAEFPIAFSVAHIHRNSKEMEHNGARGLWSLLHYY